MGRAPGPGQGGRQPVAEFCQCLTAVLDDIPLVEGDHQGAAFVEHHLGDGEILLFQQLGGVHHQHHDLGQTDRPQRILDR